MLQGIKVGVSCPERIVIYLQTNKPHMHTLHMADLHIPRRQGPSSGGPQGLVEQEVTYAGSTAGFHSDRGHPCCAWRRGTQPNMQGPRCHKKGSK